MARKKLASTPAAETPAPGNGSSTATLPAPTIRPAAPVAVAAKPAPVWPATKPSHEQVAKRAYEIWVAKGRPVGKDVDNWHQAERELGLR